VAVPENEGELALVALQDAFELQLARSTINSVSLVTGMAIVAIVGEGMALTTGVSSTFMSSLSQANINIRLIAQGSSERQIAVVVKNSDTTRALRAAHMAFTLSETTASVAILGSTGYIGTALIEQLQKTKKMLSEDLGVEMCVNIAASSSKMVVSEGGAGLDLDQLPVLMQDENTPKFDLDHISKVLRSDLVHPLSVIIDCTNSDEVSEYYERWLSEGIHVISRGAKVASGPMEQFRRVCEAKKENSGHWQYESSVGSALPIITTLRDLQETGDQIHSIEGCLSGSIAFILSIFSETVPFSEAVREAVQQDYTENDVRDDLSGLDFARKVVILARQIGLEVNLEDVEVESIIPDEIINKVYDGDTYAVNSAILEDLKCLDAPMQERLKAADAQDGAIRYKFVIDKETGKCKVSLDIVTRVDPLFRLKANENLVAFDTTRYATSPLIVKGAAAGPDLAASGIFADLLRLTRASSSSKSA
jgi:aspartokinase/homoserine dehydrogenase 1